MHVSINACMYKVTILMPHVVSRQPDVPSSHPHG